MVSFVFSANQKKIVICTCVTRVLHSFISQSWFCFILMFYCDFHGFHSEILLTFLCTGGRGGGGLRFFWIFSNRINHQHLTFSVAVRVSLARILRQVQWWSVSMVTRYNVISSRRWSHFWVKIHVFQLLSKHKKITISHCFNLISNP